MTYVYFTGILVILAIVLRSRSITAIYLSNVLFFGSLTAVWPLVLVFLIGKAIVHPIEIRRIMPGDLDELDE